MIRLEAAHEKMRDEDKARDRRIEDLELVQGQLMKKEDELYKLFKETKSELERNFVKYESKLDKKHMEMDVRVKNMPTQIMQGVHDTTQAYNRMQVTIKNTFKDFSE